jgi:adrenodoxin-NADP+ reductase
LLTNRITTQAVQNKFDSIAQDPRFTFFGNVRIGPLLSVAELRKRYHSVVLAYGASRDRMLNIPGEKTLKGIYAARDFVGWYNGQPSQRDLRPDLTRTDEAMIIGQGNVALDIARVLLSPVDVLAKTDMPEYALESLRTSRIRRVHLVGRRGPLQVCVLDLVVDERFHLPPRNCAKCLPSHNWNTRLIASYWRAKSNAIKRFFIQIEQNDA